MLKSVVIAFAMYSKIPMPLIKWKENSMKYALCFFPLVGTVLGLMMYAAGYCLLQVNCSSLLKAAVMTVIPVFITGGIHLDGFLDTLDALNSWGDKEKRLAIMKDSRSGAFAIIGGLVYFVLLLGIWSEISYPMLGVTAVGYTLSRTLSALAIISFPLAKDTGLAAAFSNAAEKKRVRISLIVWLLGITGLIIWMDYLLAVAVVVTAIILFNYHYYICLKHFGGITGDLAGHFLTIFELAIPSVCMIVSKIIY